MNTSVLLLRGDRYPLSTPANSNEGATADFLRASGNRLVVILPGMTSKEQRALRGGTIKAGFLYDSGALLWLFQLYGDKGPLLTLDAPFDVRLIPADDRHINRIDVMGNDGIKVAADIQALLERHRLDSKLLPASFKNTQQVLDVLKIGVSAITLPTELVAQMFGHPAVEPAVQQFTQDWHATFGDRLAFET